jgi:hypothetical protein
MSRLRIATTLIATFGSIVTAALFLSGSASAWIAPEAPTDNSALLTPPPSATTSNAGTSIWWFVLVALISMVATLLIVALVRAARSGSGRSRWVRNLA